MLEIMAAIISLAHTHTHTQTQTHTHRDAHTHTHGGEKPPPKQTGLVGARRALRWDSSGILHTRSLSAQAFCLIYLGFFPVAARQPRPKRVWDSLAPFSVQSPVICVRLHTYVSVFKFARIELVYNIVSLPLAFCFSLRIFSRFLQVRITTFIRESACPQTLKRHSPVFHSVFN